MRRVTVAALTSAEGARNTAMSGSANDEAIGLEESFYRQDRLLVQGLDDDALTRLAGLGFAVVARTRGLIGIPVFALSIPRSMPLDRARRVIRRSAIGARVEQDAIYRPAGDEACTGASCTTFAMINWRSGTRCAVAPSIGMIDTAVDLSHPALAGQSVESIAIDNRNDDDKAVKTSTSGSDSGSGRFSRGHGTAIATLLAGRAGGPTPGLMPNARLVAIDALHRGADGTDQTDAVALIAGIEALADRGVQVINLSLAGPPSDVLHDAIRHASARGIIIVAAAGNDGPGARPSYPGAYPEVVAVTAIDTHLAVYPRATQGSYIAVAAPGVAVSVASVDGTVATRSGTSYAVPFAVAAAATLKSEDPLIEPDKAKQALEAAAIDLGARGPDPVFGAGLVQASRVCEGPPARLIGQAAPTAEIDDAIVAGR